MHPDFNRESRPFLESSVGKKYKQKGWVELKHMRYLFPASESDHSFKKAKETFKSEKESHYNIEERY